MRNLKPLLFFLITFSFLACEKPVTSIGDSECEANQITCTSETEYKVCVRDPASKEGEAPRYVWEKQTCTSNHICVNPTAANTSPCQEKKCTPDEVIGCTRDGWLEICSADGVSTIVKQCTNGGLCFRGTCHEPQCRPTQKRCLDRKTLQVCSASGKWEVGESCPDGRECFDGECQDLCDFDDKVSSYVGCEYWSVDLPNYSDAISQPHAVVVANINPTLSATLEFFQGHTSNKITSGPNGPFNLTLQPGEIRAFPFFPQYDHLGTELFQNRAIRLVSNIPVIAYQYNPLHNAVKVYSNDGTLLLPTNAVGKEYYVLAWTHRQDIPVRSFATIVNSSGYVNHVTITPSAELMGGAQGGPYPRGVPFTVTLQPGASFNMETSGDETVEAKSHGCLKNGAGPNSVTAPCPDLTGTHIVADQKLTVFGGHQCANVPTLVDRCDHIESILTPINTWGKRYVAAKFYPRAPVSSPESDFYRIIAAEDGTVIQTKPEIPEVHGLTLNKGEWAEFATPLNFVLYSSKPTMVAQYMVGSNSVGIPRKCDKGSDAGNPTGIGDPAMTLLVPKEQWRKEYNILTPSSYEEDYVTIVAPRNTAILFDNVRIDQKYHPVDIASGVNQTYTVPVKPGQHVVTGNQQFGIISYGYACHVSYATPGGMNVESIQHHL